MAACGEGIRSELGFSPRYDLMKGWSEVNSELQQKGEI